MNVISPITVTTATLTSSTVAEPFAGEVAWNSATNYTLATEVIRATTHKKYKNILAGIDAGLPENTPLRWTESGVTNRFAMFDLYRSTQTNAPSPLTTTLTLGQRANSICALNLVADYIVVSVMQGASEVYRYEQNLNTRNVTNYYEYAYADFTNLKAVLKLDLPPISNGVITVTLSSATGTVKCGGLVIGNQTYIGALQIGAKIGSLNFSRIDRSAIDGTATLLPRPAKPTLTGRLWSPAELTDKIEALKSALDAVPAVFSGLDDNITDPRFASLLISGIYRRLEPGFDYEETNMIDIEVEEI